MTHHLDKAREAAAKPFKIVPTQPTVEMMQAGVLAWREKATSQVYAEPLAEACYQAMLAKAPAFLAASVPADEKLAEIRARQTYDHEQFYKLGEMGEYVAQAHLDRAELLTLVTALSAKLKEVEAARASQMEEGDHPKDCRCEVCRAWGA